MGKKYTRRRSNKYTDTKLLNILYLIILTLQGVDLERLQRRREQNREAAQRSRKRKRDRADSLNWVRYSIADTYVTYVKLEYVALPRIWNSWLASVSRDTDHHTRRVRNTVPRLWRRVTTLVHSDVIVTTTIAQNHSRRGHINRKRLHRTWKYCQKMTLHPSYRVSIGARENNIH